MASDITFHYFHGSGIGEPIRLLLTVGEIAFTDRRYSVDEFANMTAFKAQLPFGQMPALEVDGVFLGQTDSIARLATRLAGLYPSDPIEAARSDMIVVHQAEISVSPGQDELRRCARRSGDENGAARRAAETHRRVA